MKAIPPPSATKQITHIDGKLIIAREPATGPHPRTRIEGSPYKGVEKVLLDDETEAIICSECGWVGESTTSVSSHRAMSHVRTNFQRYPEATLRALIREVNRARKSGIQGFAGAAAEVLNQQGVKTATGQDWTASVVSHVYNQYKDRYRVRVGKPVVAANNGHGPTAAEPVDPVQLLQSIDVSLKAMSAALAVAARNLEASTPDPELVDKAARWDQMQALMQPRA